MAVHGFNEVGHGSFHKIDALDDIELEPLGGRKGRDQFVHALGRSGQDDAFAVRAAAQAPQADVTVDGLAQEEADGSEDDEKKKDRAARDAQFEENHAGAEDQADPDTGVGDLAQGAPQGFFQRVLVKSLHFEQERSEQRDNDEHPEEVLQRGNFRQNIEIDDLVTAQRVSKVKNTSQNDAIGNLIELQGQFLFARDHERADSRTLPHGGNVSEPLL